MFIDGKNPYENTQILKRQLKNLRNDILDLLDCIDTCEVIVTQMQDIIVNNLETSIEDLQYKLDERTKAEEFEKILYGKEK